MPDVKPTKLKLCLVGESGVGKTSLIKRFVYDQFDDNYITTIGAKVTIKEIKVQHPEDRGLMDVQLLIWDIIGQHGFRRLLQQAYFHGTQGIIGVCDFTRKNTLSDLEGWMEAIQGITDEIPAVFLGNKCDLEDEHQVDFDDIESFASRYKKSLAYLSSAKTGYNVDLAFKTLSEKILEKIH